jgi:hypothetical protein
MDSCDYICPFTIHQDRDVPSDFALPAQLTQPFAGIFLPQDAAGWFSRPSYPARILLLKGDALWIAAHPTARTSPLRIPLSDLEVLECGRMLLLGWIGLHGPAAEQTLRYNRRDDRTVEAFLSKLKDSWLPHTTSAAPAKPSGFGERLNRKFEWAEEMETDQSDKPVARFFQPPVRRYHRLLLLHYKSWTAGDLVAVTPRRLLWITDRNRGAYEPYGTVSRSVSLSSLLSVRPGLFDNQPNVEIVLRSGQAWRFPLAAGLELEARTFAECVQSALPFLNEPGVEESLTVAPPPPDLRKDELR